MAVVMQGGRSDRGSWAMILLGSVGEGRRQATLLWSCAEQVRGFSGRLGPQPPRRSAGAPSCFSAGPRPGPAPLLPSRVCAPTRPSWWLLLPLPFLPATPRPERVGPYGPLPLPPHTLPSMSRAARQGRAQPLRAFSAGSSGSVCVFP